MMSGNIEACLYGTRWSAAFSSNAVFLILMFLNYITLTFGAFWYYPRLIGTICNCCCGCAHFGTMVAALSYRFSPYGNYCAANEGGNAHLGGGKFDDSWTFKKDGQTLAALGAIQCIFWIIQCYCCCLPLYLTPSDNEVVQVVVQKVEKKEKKKKKDGSGSSS